MPRGLLLTGSYRTIQNVLVALVVVMGVVFCIVAALTAPSLREVGGGRAGAERAAGLAAHRPWR